MARQRVRFGVNFLPNAAVEARRWAQAAEAAGFDLVGIADSQSLYRDAYMCLALAAAGTSRVTIGPRVINPLTRHPAVAASAAATLEELAPGRTMLGIGTGDSAVLNISERPATHARLRAYVKAVRDLLETGETVWDDGGTAPPRRSVLTWPRRDARVPVYLAASGPRTLRLAGEIADGVVINTGLAPEIVRDSIEQVRIGAEAAGRRLQDVDMWWLPLCNLRDDPAAAVDEIAMTLASAGSHLSRFTTAGKHIPPHLMDAVVELGRSYRADQHDKPDSSNRDLIRRLGLTDWLAARFALAGPPDMVREQIARAAAAGATQMWMSIHFDDKAAFLERWGREIVPAFA